VVGKNHKWASRHGELQRALACLPKQRAALAARP
jgi:hypothetical protein